MPTPAPHGGSTPRHTIDRLKRPGSRRGGDCSLSAPAPLGAGRGRSRPRPLASGQRGLGRAAAARPRGPRGRRSLTIRWFGHASKQPASEVVSGNYRSHLHERGPLGCAGVARCEATGPHRGSLPEKSDAGVARRRAAARRGDVTPASSVAGFRAAASGRRGQAPKGTGGMPRRHQRIRAWKAAIMSGGAAQRASIPECPRRPGELKHLSTRRKRNQPRLPQ